MAQGFLKPPAITATVTAGIGAIAISNSTQYTSGTVQFEAGANITLQTTGQTVSIVGGAGAGGGINIAASNTTYTSGTVVFAGTNLTVNTNGQTVGLSVAAPVAQTNQTVGLYAISNTTGQSSSTTVDARSVSFAGAGNVSVGYSAGSVVISGAGGGAGGGVNIAASNTTYTSGTVVFTGQNLTVSTNGQTVGLSVPAPVAQTNQSLGLYALGNTTGQSSSTTLDARTVSISAAGGLSAGYSAGVIVLSAGAGGAGDGGNVLAAGTQTATSLGTVVFSNSNNVSFGLSGSTRITASASFAQSVQTQNLVSVNGSTGNISLVTGSSLSSSQNGSTITFGLASNITTALQSANAGYLTSQSNQAASGSNASSTFQTLSFGISNGASFYFTNGSIVLSYTVPPAQSVQTQNMVSVNGSTGAISLATGSSLSSSQNGSTITFGLASNITTALQSANANYLTSQSNQAASGSNASSTFQTLSFGASNGASFYFTNGSMVLSYTVPSVPAQTNQTLGLYAVSNTTGAGSSTTADARSLSFQGAGVASVGYTNGSVVISVPAGGGGGFSGGMSTGGNTAGTTGLVSNQLVLAGGANITLSQSVNANSATLSIVGGGGGAVSQSLHGWANVELQGSAVGSTHYDTQHAVVHLHPPVPSVANAVRFFMSLSQPTTSFATANNTTYGMTMSETVYMALYTRMTGASSLSASEYTSSSWTKAHHLSCQQGAGASYSTGQTITFPRFGVAGDTSSFSGSGTATVTTHSFGIIPNGSGLRCEIMLPFAITFTGPCYLRLNIRSAVTTQRSVGISNVRLPWASIYAGSIVTGTLYPFGGPTNNTMNWYLHEGTFGSTATAVPVFPLTSLSSILPHRRHYQFYYLA